MGVHVDEAGEHQRAFHVDLDSGRGGERAVDDADVGAHEVGVLAQKEAGDGDVGQGERRGGQGTEIGCHSRLIALSCHL